MIATRKFFFLSSNLQIVVTGVLKRLIHREHDAASSHSMYNYLANIMGVYVSTAKRQLVHNVELTSKPLLEIVETYKILEKLNFDKTKIAENISVLALSAAEVKQRHRGMKELGIDVFQIPEVLRFPEIVSQSKESLIWAGFTSSTDFDLRNFDFKESTDELEQVVRVSYVSCDDSLSLRDVRCRIFTNMIGRKLQFNEEVAHQMFQSCLQLQCSSLSYVTETLNILKDEFRLNQQIRSNPIVLSVPPEDLESIVSIALEFDLDVRFMALERPRILCTTPNSFKLICHHMNEYGVPMENLKRCPAVFDHPPNFILHGLRTLSVWPDFKSIRSNSNLFRLLTVARQADQRLSYLERDSFVDCSLKHLITKDELFKDFFLNTLREENVVYEEILFYVADRLECSYEDVSQNFDLNSGSGTASMVVARNTLTYLLRRGFKKEVICKGSALVFHPWQVVDKVLKDLPSSEIAQPYSEWEQNENVLHLVLYIIRRDKVGEGEWVHPPIEVREDMESSGFIEDQELQNNLT